MLPVSYALRNLLRSPGRLVQVVVGSGLVVLLLCLAAAFQTGMDRALEASGDARNVIVLGAGSEESAERSEIKASVPQIIAASVPGIAEDYGQPAVSGEVVYNGEVTVLGEKAQGLLRGVTPAAVQVHRSVRVVEGDFPAPGEVLVGASAARVLGVPETALAIGSSLQIEDETFTIAGRFVAPGSVLASEIWVPRSQLMAISGRDTISCAVVRMAADGDVSDLEYFAATRLDLELVAIPEPAYYAKLASFYGPIKLMAWITALLVTAAAIMGGMTTLYAAIVTRIRELATLQAIGFRHWMIVLSVIQEGILAVGLGVLAALALALGLFDGLELALASGAFALHISPGILLLGLLSGLALALIGCAAPLWRCLVPPLATTLRGVA